MKYTKKDILVFSDWYLPGYKAGGPIRSLANLANSLEHNFYIVTRNTDHHSTEAYENIVPNKWLKISDRIMVIYFEEAKLTSSTFASILKERSYDRIYLNSLFSPRFTILPLREISKAGMKNKTILAPRGMLKAGALSVKAKKKKVFLFIARMTGLYRGILWHATNDTEAGEIRQHFGEKTKIRTAPNLIAGGQQKKIKPKKEPGSLKLISIARISPEKGILEGLKFIASSGLGPGLECHFYGTQQNHEYLQECMHIASVIEGALITFPGEIAHHLLPEVISDAHFFYLTTWGENFGHAIAESLLESTPVIISDRTPWKKLKESGAGWELPLDVSSFVPVLRQCWEMNDADYSALSGSAFEFGQQAANDPQSIRQAYSVFE
jgi:glycosyltransferase involved in cell wall biosynthesis